MEGSLLEKAILEEEDLHPWTLNILHVLRSYTSRLSTHLPPIPHLRRSIQIAFWIIFIHIILLTNYTYQHFSAHYHHRPLRIFLPGQNYFLPLATHNATLGVRLTHEPLDQQSFGLVILKATNDIMEQVGTARRGGFAFDADRLAMGWFERSPSPSPTLQSRSYRAGENTQHVIPHNVSDVRSGRTGVYLNLDMSGPSKQSVDYKLIMGVLRLLHEMRARPYGADVIVRDNGFEADVIGRGCLSGRNGTCASKGREVGHEQKIMG